MEEVRIMAEYHRLQEPNALGPNQRSERDQVYDAGAFPKLQAQLRVVSAGTAGNIVLQHAAVMEPDAFTDIAGTSTALNAVSNNFYTVSNFLRYIRWVTDGAVAGNPKVIIDIMAKDA